MKCLQDSKELNCFLNSLQKAIQKKLDADRINKVVKIQHSLEIPKRWGGYEIPMNLNTLETTEFKKHYCEVLEIFTASNHQEFVKRVIKDSKKEKTIIINAAVVSQCKKSKKPGLFLFWKR